jgi:ABC-type transport system substrate-binding protein
VSYPTFLALVQRRKTSQMSWAGWTEDYPDPADFFDPIFSKAAINDEDSANWSFYDNPRLDEILDKARHELDKNRRYALYGEANHIVCDDAPWAFTYFSRFYIVHQAYVRDYRPHPVWNEYLTKTWIDRAPTEIATAGGPSWRSLTGRGPRSSSPPTSP